MVSANQTTTIVTITSPGPQGPQGPTGPPGGATTGSNTFTGNQTITGSILISGSIIPAVGVGQTTSSFDLGSVTAAWKDIYVSEGSIKFIKSGSTTVTLSAANGGISVDGGSVISADGVSGQFITSKSLNTDITVKDSNNSLLMGPIEVEINKEIVVEEGSDLTIFGDIENTTPDDLSISTLNVNSNTTLGGQLTVTNNINALSKINSAFYTNTKDISSDVIINNNESALIIGETIIEEDKEISIEDDSELTIFGDIDIQNVATADTALFAINASFADSSSYSNTASYTTSASFSNTSSYTITASYALNAVSTSTFPYSGSAIITGSLTVNNGTNNVVNTSNYQLLNNGTLSIDWQNKILNQAGNRTTVDWDQAYLNDYTNEALSINWENRTLIDPNNTTSVDWENRTLNASDASTAINYSNSSSLLLTAGGSIFDIAKHSTLTSNGAGSLTITSPTTTISGSILLTNPTGIYNFTSASSTITGSTPTLSATAMSFAQSGANFFIYVYIGGRWRSASLF